MNILDILPFKNFLQNIALLICSALSVQAQAENYDPVYQERNNSLLNLQAVQSRSFALLFSLIQCFPDNSTSNIDSDIRATLLTNQIFNPEAHLNEYTNLTDIQNLISLVEHLETSGTRNDLPFTNAPANIVQLNIILKVLFFNTQNWTLFYNTAAWLLLRVNKAQLFWALSIVAAEKFSATVTVPSAVEIFPQLFVPKHLVLGGPKLNTQDNPVYYWISDPGLNEFHVHWHMDNPFFWDEAVYGVPRDRKGEIFLYMHHNIVNRYNAELLSNGLPEVKALVLDPDYKIPKGYASDILNLDYTPLISRPDGDKIGNWDNDGQMLAQLRTYFDRLTEGVEKGYLLGPDGNHINIRGFNGTNLLGATLESSNAESANLAFYGSFHNFMHRILAGIIKPQEYPIPGVQAHSETGMRDRVFYQIHERVEGLFWKYKQTLQPYTQEDLEFPGVSILEVDIVTQPLYGNIYSTWQSVLPQVDWPFTHKRNIQPPILTTYMKTRIYDISTAARPCRSVNDQPMPVQVQTLDYIPFTYIIAIESKRKEVAYGMVRIFMWQEHSYDGKVLSIDEAHERAIEMDRFRITLNPEKVTVITRQSLESSLTRMEPSPGIKTLYNVKPSSNILTSPYIRRACAFPNNMLVPKGTREGVPFKFTVYVSDETDAGLIEDNQYPHYPFCGALNGLPYPDKRPMGFPFDRLGTKFNLTNTMGEAYSSILEYSPWMQNVKQFNVVVKHQS